MDVTKLHNLVNIEDLIAPLKTKDNRTYQALHNISVALRNIVDTTQGIAQPNPHYIERFYAPTLQTGAVPIPYQIKMPDDPNWNYTGVVISQISAALTTAGSGTTQVDVLVAQNHGITTAKTILQANKISIAATLKVVNVNIFNINQFVDGDIITFNVISVGTSAAGLELTFRGMYSISPK